MMILLGLNEAVVQSDPQNPEEAASAEQPEYRWDSFEVAKEEAAPLPSATRPATSEPLQGSIEGDDGTMPTLRSI